jgi:hypothetical protein
MSNSLRGVPKACKDIESPDADEPGCANALWLRTPRLGCDTDAVAYSSSLSCWSVRRIASR